MGDAGRHMGLIGGRMHGRAGGAFGGRFGRSVLQKTSIIPAPPSSYLPTDIANLIAWHSSDYGIHQSGGYIFQWDDRSGNNYNLLQATGAYQPTLISDQINGLPVVRFDGLNDYMKVSFGRTYSFPITEFIVFNIRYVDAGYPYQQITDGYGTYFGLRYWLGTYLDMRANADIVRYLKTAPFGYQLNECFYKSPNGAIYENGNIQSPDPSVLPSYSTDGITLGSYNSGGVNFNGDIAERFVFADEISSEDRIKMESYINTKYALW